MGDIVIQREDFCESDKKKTYVFHVELLRIINFTEITYNMVEFAELSYLLQHN